MLSPENAIALTRSLALTALGVHTRLSSGLSGRPFFYANPNTSLGTSAEHFPQLGHVNHIAHPGERAVFVHFSSHFNKGS
jgi:hypothetical protein